MTDDAIKRRIVTIRGMKVILDFDLAQLYGLRTKSLNQAVSRHKNRFVGGFMFDLRPREVAELEQAKGSITTGTKHQACAESVFNIWHSHANRHFAGEKLPKLHGRSSKCIGKKYSI